MLKATSLSKGHKLCPIDGVTFRCPDIFDVG